MYLKNNIFRKSACLDHVNDLFPICKEAVKNGIVSFTVISYNGPDYNLTSYKNELLYYELWKESKLDFLTVTSNAAGLSAFNPIEHLWSPLSNCLTSVTLNGCMDRKEIPTYLDTKLDNQEKEN